jgi:hypothetical protein
MPGTIAIPDLSQAPSESDLGYADHLIMLDGRWPASFAVSAAADVQLNTGCRA